MEKKIMTFLALVITTVVLNASPTTSECYIEVVKLVPCSPFILSPSLKQPSEMCCKGMRDVVAEADTTEKRRKLCQCLKDKAVAASVKVDPSKVQLATTACGLKTIAPIDPNVDCSTIQ